MKAVYLRWSIDIDDIYKALFSISPSEAGSYLGITGEKFSRASQCFDIYDTIKEAFTKDRLSFYKLLDLPTQISLPKKYDIPLKSVTCKMESDIYQLLNQKYGHTCENFCLEEEPVRAKQKTYCLSAA